MVEAAHPPHPWSQGAQSGRCGRRYRDRGAFRDGVDRRNRHSGLAFRHAAFDQAAASTGRRLDSVLAASRRERITSPPGLNLAASARRQFNDIGVMGAWDTGQENMVEPVVDLLSKLSCRWLAPTDQDMDTNSVHLTDQ